MERGVILILLFLFLMPITIATNFNPSYPRTAAFFWGPGRAEFYAQFDMVVAGKNDGMFQGIRDINPDAILVWTVDWQAGGPFRYDFPEEWAFRNEDEKIVYYTTSRNLLFADPTDFCDVHDGSEYPEYAGKKYNDALVEKVLKDTDFSIYDGVASDGIWTKFWGISGIDFDRDGSDDGWDEQSEALQDGWRTVMKKFKDNMPAGKVLVMNYGWGTGILDSPHIDGRFWEIWGKADYEWEAFRETTEKMNDHPGPDVTFINIKPKLHGGHGVSIGDKQSEDYPRFARYGVASSCITDTFANAGDFQEHYWAVWVDEMGVDLGYPTSEAQNIERTCYESLWFNVCVMARFFDNGVVIVNPTKDTLTISDDDLKQLTGYTGPYYRFRGSHDPNFNNGQLFDQVDLVSSVWGDADNNEFIGDGILLVKTPTTVVSDIIVDNDFGPTTISQVKAEVSGDWENGRKDCETSHVPYWALGPWYCGHGDLGNLPHYYTDDRNSEAVFTINISVPGNYDVYEWHAWAGKDNRLPSSTKTPFEIKHAAGTDTVVINQQDKYAEWILLGSYDFSKGTDNYVKVKTQGTDNYVIADAVKLVYKPEPEFEPEDLNQDGVIDVIDLVLLVRAFGTSEHDLTVDGVVNVSDLLLIIKKL